MPAVIAPSPITATTRRFSPVSFEATAMPSAALIEVLECAVPNVSYSLSSRRGKAGNAAPHAQLLHALAPAGQHLVAIGLVTDVPYEAVVRRVEHVMQRDGELDRAQVGREMAARSGSPIRAGTGAARGRAAAAGSGRACAARAGR